MTVRKRQRASCLDCLGKSGGARRDRTADLVNAIFGFGLSAAIPEMSGVAVSWAFLSKCFPCVPLLFPSRVLTMLLLNEPTKSRTLGRVALEEERPIAKGRITKRAVDAAKARKADSYLWDNELSGFGLKVTPTGRKVYLVQYRLGGRKGRTRRVTIGQHGQITPTFARDEAKRLLGAIATGRDPAAERDTAKADKTLGVVLDDFMAEHVKRLKPATVEEYQRLARLYVKPRLQNRAFGELKRPDIARLHHELSDKPYQANRVLAFLSALFNWAEKHGLRPDGTNPCRHVEKYPEGRRERFLSQAEWARLGDALRQAEVDKSCSPWAIAAIRLLALTGARRNEILTLRWEHVSEEHGSLLLPDSKTGRKTIRLNAPALALLDEIPRLEGNPYVNSGERPGRHLVNLEKPWRRMRAAAKLDDVRLHDLRHSFASVGASGGQSLVIIGKMLGHSQPATTARYAHLADDLGVQLLAQPTPTSAHFGYSYACCSQ
jgi:integrase